MSIRLRQLRAFKAIVDHGSVTEAADALGLTQSSLSKSLAAFEAYLGFPLFHRIGRRLRLSAQGQEFLAQTANAIELLDGLEAAAASIRDNRAAHYRVAAIGPLLMSSFLPRALAHFSELRPGVDLAIETKLRIEMEDWVAGGHSDVGLTIFPVQSGRFGSRELARVTAVTVVPAGHRLAQRSALSPRDISGERIIMPRLAARVRNMVESGFLQAGYTLSPRLETTTAVAAAHLVAEGNGIAVLDPITVTGLSQDKIAVIPWEPKIELTYGMIWPEHRGATGLDQDLCIAAMKATSELSDILEWFEVTQKT